MKSVVSSVGSQEFARVRVGIGSPKSKANLINYVIGQIPIEDIIELNQGINVAANAVIEILKKRN